MDIVISASNGLAKWLGLELPRMPSLDGKKVGTQSLQTATNLVSWQCHIISNRYRSRHKTIIAVEAHSRYALLIPCSGQFTVEEFEQELLNRWLNELIHHTAESGKVEGEDIETFCNQIQILPKQFQWFRNTDMSVQGHVSDAGQWVTDTLSEYGDEYLTVDNALGLGFHINEQFKRAKDSAGKKVRFYPIERLVADGLERFWSGSVETRGTGEAVKPIDSTGVVISMADYLKSKAQANK